MRSRVCEVNNSDSREAVVRYPLSLLQISNPASERDSQPTERMMWYTEEE